MLVNRFIFVANRSAADLLDASYVGYCPLKAGKTSISSGPSVVSSTYLLRRFDRKRAGWGKMNGKAAHAVMAIRSG
jgi:hypothetical protein